LAGLLPLLHAAAERHGRDPSAIPVYCSGRPGATTVDVLRKYEALGVHSIQVPLATLDDLERFADDVLPSFR